MDNTEQMDNLLGVVVNKINNQWIKGTLGFIKKYHYYLYTRIKDTEKKMDEAYKANDIEAFRGFLDDWYYLHTDAIELYEASQKDLVLFSVFKGGS